MLQSVKRGIKQVFQEQQTGYKREECGDGKVVPKYVRNRARDNLRHFEVKFNILGEMI